MFSVNPIAMVPMLISRKLFHDIPVIRAGGESEKSTALDEKNFPTRGAGVLRFHGVL